jgi:triosephosphate isomerase (TIM)
MNLTASAAREMVAALRKQIDPDASTLAKDRDIVIAPPAVDIPAVAEAIRGSSIELGAQNMHWEDQGAFTGEISAPMLEAYSVRYVILGHSERRTIFLESDATVNQKVRAAIRHKMRPIMCVGESLAQHDAGETLATVLAQTQAGLDSVGRESAAEFAIAYEPIWAIGTGRTATPEHAQMVHGAIREALLDKWDPAAARAVRILYGGSVTPDNVDSLLAKPDIDGALVGGASLKADSFARIIRANF